MSCRVLIVEDEILVALDIEAAIEDAGFEVVGIAADSTTALAKASDAEIAFVDLNLRDGLTGIDIGRRLAEEIGITVIYMTANPTLLGKGISGTIGVLTKPCDHSVMHQALQFAASRRLQADMTLAKPPENLRLFHA